MTVLGVLGPLLLRGPDGPVHLGSARQRRLLVALAAHLDQAVDVGRLVELIWGGALPADPVATVQTHVARLRRLLPDAVVLATTAGGYRLVADRAAVDLTAFTDRLAAVDTGDGRDRPERLAAALALWRGRPFAELDHPSLEPEVARLEALHAAAAEQHAEALLAAGRVGESVAVAEALVAADPLREGAVAVLMRSLVAAHRQSDALAAFARLRRRLADELGLDPGPPLRALEQAVLRQELPVDGGATPPSTAPRSAAVARLPALPSSSFVGRAADLDRVVGHLRGCRVVTLCGPGGVGKTRLATHAAAAVVDRYADGVTTVAFGDGGAADVVPLLAAALRLTDAPVAGPLPRLVERIVEVLTVQRRLLLLDNCEHVPDEVAPLVEAITAGAPGVDLLLTSREPLRVDGEQVVPVPPLDPAAAARLLTDRVRGADPTADPDDALVAEVVRRLDGLPLALELAAARARSLGLRGLCDALADESAGGPFAVLRAGRRAAAPRHRSLHDVVAWSYGLLDAGQRTLFERLSVFAGPVERAAVGAVCGDTTDLPDLVDRSLVVRVEGAPARFGMLETLRAFGRTRLAVQPGAHELRIRHATWAVALADEVASGRRGPGEVAAVRRFDAHLADLRRAHEWLCARGPVDELLRLTVPVAALSYQRSRADLVLLLEGTLARIGRLVPRAVDGPAEPLAARLLGWHAHTLWQRGDLAGARRQAAHALAVAAAGDDPTAARDGHGALGNALHFGGDLDGARRHARIAHDLAVAAGDPEVATMARGDLALACAYAGDQDASRRHETALVDLVAAAGSVSGRAWLAYVRGECRAERDDPAAAAYLEEAVTAAEEADLSFVAGVARHTLLTSAARTAGDPAAVLSALGALLDHWHAFGAWTQLWLAMRAVIETLSRTGRHRDAALLLGALGVSPRAADVYGADSTRVDAVERAARAALGAEFEPLRAEGAALGDVGALALARRVTRATGRGSDTSGTTTAATSGASTGAAARAD